jgi:hypothetical protein
VWRDVVHVSKMANELFVLTEIDNLNAIFGPLKSTHRIKVNTDLVIHHIFYLSQGSPNV